MYTNTITFISDTTNIVLSVQQPLTWDYQVQLYISGFIPGLTTASCMVAAWLVIRILRRGMASYDQPRDND
jgi:hypothetical protein